MDMLVTTTITFQSLITWLNSFLQTSWQRFQILKKENFILGKIDDGTGTANGIIKKEPGEDGTTTTVKKEDKPKPKPKEVEEYEKKNSGKKKIKVRTGQTGG